MGNCVQSSSSGCRHGVAVAGASDGGGRLVVERMQRRRSEKAGTAPQSSSVGKVKVKMVLTRGELGWLVARLKAGDRRLEGALRDMVARESERQQRDGGGWRPSLESIVECPAFETAADGSNDDTTYP